ncbi:16S rRNA processing protein RimM [bacterium]|nr:16S rRNA processing protein RimM [bacterium]
MRLVMNEMIYIGKTVSTFGIKGELKVISDFEKCDKAYKIGNKILINNIEHVISGIRYHKNYILLEIDDLKNINNILKYVGFNIYIKRMDLHLEENEFLYKDLINSDVIDNDGSNLGKIIEVEQGVNLLIKVKGSKEFYIPYVDEYIISFDLNNKKLYTKNAKDLIL